MPYPRPNASRWGHLQFFSLPSAMIVQNRLKITPAAVKVLVYLYQQAKQQQQRTKKSSQSDSTLTISASYKVLMTKTGLSAPTVQGALANLEENCFIERQQGRKKNGAQYGVNGYVLLNPETADPLKHFFGSKLIFGNGAQKYFTAPTCFVTEHQQSWSLAKLSRSATALYMCLLWRANFTRSSEFTIKNELLKELTGIKSADTLREAKGALHQLGLVQITGTRELSIVVHDPHTREKPRPRDTDTENPANYFQIDEKGRRRSLDSNRLYSDAAYVRKLIKACLPDTEIIERSASQLAIHCPWHADTTPSCVFTLAMQRFWCFGCKASGKEADDYSGSLLWFVHKVKGCTTAEARLFMAEVAGARFAKTENVSAEEAAAEADAIYEWEDEQHWVSNRKVRVGYGADKDMRWQHLSEKNEWVWGKDAQRLPLVYRLPYLKHANVVAILEGERDVETFLSLKLKGVDGALLAATTTGNADSWKSIVAKKYLLGKQVVLLPDNGTAGQKYRVAVEQSLQRFGIPYKVVQFNDVEVNDLTDWLNAGHTGADLVRRINEAQVFGGNGSSEPWISDWQPERQREEEPVPVSL
jgi:hypothetical protein